jgi:hypothetical protein
MRVPTVARRYAVGLLVSVCALVAAQLLMRPAAVDPPAKTPPRLTLAWIDGGDRLEVAGDGYRPNGVVVVRLGSGPIQQARADHVGHVLVDVPSRLIAGGQPGASVIVTGRSRLGTFRSLVSAVPPRAAAVGPIDVLPWLIAGAALTYLALTALRRLRRRPPHAAPL